MSGPKPVDPELRAEVLRARGVAFVCSGNMLRSAFAELYARHRGLALPVRSLATTYRNDAIHPEARAALLRRGVPAALVAGFRPTHLDDTELERGWLAMAMTREHLAALQARGAVGARLLRELEGSEEEIEDPLFSGNYRRVFDTVARCVDRLVSLPPR